MEFWEKLKESFQKGKKEITEFSGELVEKGKKFSEDGLSAAQKLYSQIEQKTNEASAIVKLKMEISRIRKEIQTEKRELGRQVFELSQTSGKKITKAALSDQIEKISELEKQLEEKNKEYDLLRKDMSDSYAVDKLSEDLEKSGSAVDFFIVPEKSEFTGKMLKELSLPKEVLVASVKKGGKVVIPDGNTKLEAGDQVTVIGKEEEVKRLVESFS